MPKRPGLESENLSHEESPEKDPERNRDLIEQHIAH